MLIKSQLPRQSTALPGRVLVLLVAYKLALLLLPFRWLARNSPVGKQRHHRATYPAEVARAIQTTSRQVPLGFSCLVQALAARHLLRGYPDLLLLFGVQRTEQGEFAAHAWLTLHGKPLLGGETADGFKPIARWT